jgi:hypothetical protein
MADFDRYPSIRPMARSIAVTMTNPAMSSAIP